MKILKSQLLWLAAALAFAGAKPAPHKTPAAKFTPTPITTPSPERVSLDKPKLETLLKEKSIKRVVEEYDIITNSEWDDDTFKFVNAALIRAPLSYSRPKIMDFSMYPKLSGAIKKFDYDPVTQTIEMIGEAGGLRMHSWLKVDQKYWDEIHYVIVRGDMVGFTVDAFLWDREGKTLAVARGMLPDGKKMLPSFVTVVFKPLSEVVIGVATKNFRSYIEEEHKKLKSP